MASVPDLRLAHGQCLEGYGGTEAYYPMLEALGQLSAVPAATPSCRLWRCTRPPGWCSFPPW
jgi:hypothetical protein